MLGQWRPAAEEGYDGKTKRADQYEVVEKEGEKPASTLRVPHKVRDDVDDVEKQQGDAEVDESDAQSRGTHLTTEDKNTFTFHRLPVQHAYLEMNVLISTIRTQTKATPTPMMV